MPRRSKKQLSTDNCLDLVLEITKTLKPCPCCGGTANFYLWESQMTLMRFRCDRCGLSSRVAKAWDRKEIEITAFLWNRRVNENGSENA